MRDRLLMLGQRLAFIDKSTWGPGRVDTFNAPKALLNFPMEHADPSELIGNVDFPSVWHQGPRKGMQLHWDGNNTSVDERNLSAAFGTGRVSPFARYRPRPAHRQMAGDRGAAEISVCDRWPARRARGSSIPAILRELPRHQRSAVPPRPATRQ